MKRGDIHKVKALLERYDRVEDALAKARSMQEYGQRVVLGDGLREFDFTRDDLLPHDDCKFVSRDLLTTLISDLVTYAEALGNDLERLGVEMEE